MTPLQLFEQYIHCIPFVLNKIPYQLTREEREDFQSEARIALWRAANRWDSERGVLFKTYAIAAIKNAVIYANRLRQRRGFGGMDKLESESYARHKNGTDATFRHPLGKSVPYFDSMRSSYNDVDEETEAERKVRYLQEVLPVEDYEILEDIVYSQTKRDVCKKRKITPGRLLSAEKKARQLLDVYQLPTETDTVVS